MNEQFGEEIKKLRFKAGIGLTEMSRRTGIARGHLYRIESGETTEPHIGTLNTLAHALDVDPEDLYDLAWRTIGSGPGLPSPPIYFRSQYHLGDEEIAAVQQAIKRITDRRTRQSKTPAATKTKNRNRKQDMKQ